MGNPYDPILLPPLTTSMMYVSDLSKVITCSTADGVVHNVRFSGWWGPLMLIVSN